MKSWCETHFAGHSRPGYLDWRRFEESGYLWHIDPKKKDHATDAAAMAKLTYMSMN